MNSIDPVTVHPGSVLVGVRTVAVQPSTQVRITNIPGLWTIAAVGKRATTAALKPGYGITWPARSRSQGRRQQPRVRVLGLLHALPEGDAK